MNELVDEILTAPDEEARKALIDASDIELIALIQSKDNEIIDRVLKLADQRLANRIFSILSIDALRKALDRASGPSLTNVLIHFQPGILSELLSQASNELVGKLISNASSARTRANIVKALPAQRRAHWKLVVRQQEDEVKQIHKMAEDGLGSLLEERQRLLVKIDEAIHSKEQVLKSFDEESRIKTEHHHRLLAEAQERLVSLEDAISKRQATVDAREKALAERLAKIDEENNRQVQQKIEAKVPEFVTAALRVLEDREKAYRGKAAQWTAHGTLVLLIAIIATIAISIYGYSLTTSVNDISWQALFFVSFKGLVVLGVLGLWAKHAFTVSNAYMHEAIKRSDRAHAITFGKLYLEIYGNTVDRKELIDIFENWNITSESAFSRANPAGFEPQIIDKLGEIMRLSERSKPA